MQKYIIAGCIKGFLIIWFKILFHSDFSEKNLPLTVYKPIKDMKVI